MMMMTIKNVDDEGLTRKNNENKACTKIWCGLFLDQKEVKDMKKPIEVKKETEKVTEYTACFAF